MVRAARRIRRARSLATALAMVAALAAFAPTGDAGAICKQCLSNNDTTFTPGKGSIGRYLWRALAPPVAFVGADGRLRCAMPATTGWQIEVADPIAAAGGCSLELDAARDPKIGYHDANGMLFCAQRLGTTWIREPIDPVSAVIGGASMANIAGTLGIAYVDVVTGLLKYAERDAAGTWHAHVVAPAGGGEAYPSLIADGGLRAIAYYEASSGDLRLALSQDGIAWSTSLIDSTGDVGGYASLVGGPSHGGFGVAYYDFGNADLRYAYGVQDAWTIQTLDGAGVSVGRFCSAVAFAGTPSDHVGIAYYDRTHGDLKYARKEGTWVFTVLDTTGDAGGWASAGGTPSPNDTLGVAHVDRATGDLNYEWRASGVTAVAPLEPRVVHVRVAWRRAADGGSGRLLFTVPSPGTVRVTVYDAQGRLMAVLRRGDLPAGATEIRWDGRDERGVRVGAGMFFARVETMGGTGTALAILTR